MGRPCHALLAVLVLFGPLAARAENLRIAVYHTNDIHGWILPRSAHFHKPNPERLIGGAAVLANRLKREKGPRLLLDAGDWFQGTPEGNLSRGRSLADLFNALGYDAVAAGNHDFDFGEDNLKALAGRLKMPVLAANVYRVKDGRRADYLKPWIIKDVGGVRVGIFGLLTTNMPRLTFADNFAGLRFRREIDEAREAVKALRERGATVIVAVTHMGFERDGADAEGDKALAAAVAGIDLVVGGHSHTFLKEPYRDPVHGALIVQAGTTLSAVGRVALEVDPRTKKVVSSTAELINLWIDELGEDPSIQKVVEPYAQEVRRAYDVVVATAAAALIRRSEGESALGNWMTDCSRRWAKTDVAFQNAGGIRADMQKGPVTLRHLYNIMPFDNRVVTLTMSGRLIREVLDHGVGPGKGMLQVSGVSFTYDREAPRGERIASASVGGRPLDRKGFYTVSTIDFLTEGGDGYTPFGLAQKKESTQVLLRDVLRWCAEGRPVITVPEGGRMASRAAD